MPRRATDPYPNFHFRLELGHIQVAGFAECTGLQMETKVLDYKEGGRNSHTLKFPEHTEMSNVTLKKGVSDSNELFSWAQSLAEGNFDKKKNARPGDPDTDNEKSCIIYLRDEMGNDKKKWTLFRPLPVKWVGPELKASANEISIETLEIAHEGIIQESVPKK